MVRLIFEAILLLLINTLSLVGLGLRLLPDLWRAFWFAVQVLFRLTYLGYRWVLDRLAPFAMAIHIDLIGSPWRMLATTVFSVLLGLLMLTLFQQAITVFNVALCVAHGVLVGLIWDNLGPPSGLTLGV